MSSVDKELHGAQPEASGVTVGDWTGRLPNESGARRKQRIQQGLWRVEHCRWPAGKPQKDQRVRERYPTLPNWLAEVHDGVTVEEAGLNIMSPPARSYTRARLPVLEAIDGKAEPDRLWRNLLSSQPMAFSIAGHLHHQRDEAMALMSAMTGLPVAGLTRLEAGDDNLINYVLDGIEAEWFPPRTEHTGDMSGCDIACCLGLTDGRRVLVTIEVKYVDTFSARPVVWDRYEKHLTALGLDEAATAALVNAGCSQVLRQVMITDSIRRRGLATGVGPGGRVDEAVAVVLAREDDETARGVAKTLDRTVGDTVPVWFWSHRHLFDEAAMVETLSGWAREMAVRYLSD